MLGIGRGKIDYLEDMLWFKFILNFIPQIHLNNNSYMYLYFLFDLN